MKEAKDTVIDLTDMGNYSLKIAMTSILKQQAEITWDKAFKAGYEERDRWLSPKETDRLEEAMMAGKRLVVEWIHEWHRDVEEMEEWQAQKKVWFNEKV